MKFRDFDSKMRLYETAADYCVPPENYLVARLDGRSFTRLTKETCAFDAPFDERFRDLMVATAEGLMQCGFRVRYGYTQSDEISLLLERDEQLFGRKLRKYDSTLAGEASARFSLLLGQPATFDCRISPLPNAGVVLDYFLWRSADAARNALSGWCYWTLRKAGLGQAAATRRLFGLSVGQKHELLFEHGVHYGDLPLWQKRGVGLDWETYQKPAHNPLTGQTVAALRRRIRRDYELPMKNAWRRRLEELLAAPAGAHRIGDGTLA